MCKRNTPNYKALRNMYHQRKNHKLKEWRFFCDQILMYLDDRFIPAVKGGVDV